MWKSWFLHHPLTPIALGAMAFFIGAFIVVVWRAWKSNGSDLDERARLPLLDDGETPHVH